MLRHKPFRRRIFRRSLRRRGCGGGGCCRVVVGGCACGLVVVGGLDDEGSCARAREACAVGDDVLNGVGGGLGGVDFHRTHLRAVDVCRDAEVEVGLRAGDGCAEVVVGGADLDDRRVRAVDLDDGRGVRRR